ncbi:GAF domain-containing protein [Vitiosangium sp. GDMCC 1.1324]|uniref:GAF domain-containing protein n=1 Tax=Vitiosangium sp. (strain GDMCC 1.1324) TaxID=2138576 RepID=UPI000D3AF3E8|nr:GAF domain-containing protein [Vitiosangium sp. GDMCC 1.1324]PTL76428.1 hypothetical protein DAT35_49775 [Vitiosangium sp. GDMCC 1.1324]
MIRSIEKNLGELRSENAALRIQVATLRAELSDTEAQMTNLINLCVASHRLHETCDRRELFDVLREIINNIVGSEELGIFELDRARSALSLVYSMGIEPERFQCLSLGSGVIGHTALTGELFIASDGARSPAAGNETGLTACIPLRFCNRIWGVIAIFGMLPQKPALKDQDRELFALLEKQAGLVLATSETHPDGNRS